MRELWDAIVLELCWCKAYRWQFDNREEFAKSDTALFVREFYYANRI